MTKKHAIATWQGTGKEGKGSLFTESKTLDNVPFNFVSRFEDGKHTNPEELIAAAHASCFSMKLSFLLTDAGFPPELIETKCEVTFDTDKGLITQSHLSVNVKAGTISTEKFDKLITEAKDTCPISKSIKAEITCDAKLSTT